MTTALDIITDALLEIGAHDLGQSVPAEDSEMALRRLNRMIQTWSLSPALYAVLPEVTITTTGAQSYTIGPTGDVVATRPVRVDRVTCVDSGGIETEVSVLNRESWDAIAIKNTTGNPVSECWYDATATNGRLWVFPKSTGDTLKVEGVSLITSFALVSTEVTLPVGYEQALALNLAIELAGPYRQPVTPDLRARAAGALRAVKRSNTEPLLMNVMETGRQSYIERGY